jgi:hypothetical protein
MILMKEEMAAVEDSAETEVSAVVQEKCTKQFAMIASKIVKYRLNQQKVSQFIVKNVTLNTKNIN